MTPARRLHIISLVTNLYSARDEYRGRTVPPIRSDSSWDGRARFAGIPLADKEAMQDAYNATRELLERDREC